MTIATPVRLIAFASGSAAEGQALGVSALPQTYTLVPPTGLPAGYSLPDMLRMTQILNSNQGFPSPILVPDTSGKRYVLRYYMRGILNPSVGNVGLIWLDESLNTLVPAWRFHASDPTINKHLGLYLFPSTLLATLDTVMDTAESYGGVTNPMYSVTYVVDHTTPDNFVEYSLWKHNDDDGGWDAIESYRSAAALSSGGPLRIRCSQGPIGTGTVDFGGLELWEVPPGSYGPPPGSFIPLYAASMLNQSNTRWIKGDLNTNDATIGPTNTEVPYVAEHPPYDGATVGTGGTANAAVTFTANTIRDTREIFLPANIGKTVTALTGGKTLVITSVAGDIATGSGGWSGGGQPVNGGAWRMDGPSHLKVVGAGGATHTQRFGLTQNALSASDHILAVEAGIRAGRTTAAADAMSLLLRCTGATDIESVLISPPSADWTHDIRLVTSVDPGTGLPFADGNTDINNLELTIKQIRTVIGEIRVSQIYAVVRTGPDETAPMANALPQVV